MTGHEPSAAWQFFSYWLKWERAVQHFEEVKGLIAPYDAMRPCAVSHDVEGDEQDHIYRIWATDDPNEWIAVVFGDFLFNLRSGLDHLRALLVPERYRNKGEFPILVHDIWERDPQTGDYEKGTKSERQRWKAATRGMNPDAIREIDNLQPFRMPNQPAAHYALAMIQRFNNADKHRELTTIVHHLRNVELRTNGGEWAPLSLPDNRVIGNGAALPPLDSEVNMEARGAIVVGITDASQRLWEPLSIGPIMIEYVRAVFLTLERFVVGAPATSA